jgi:kynurenine formamidase
MRRRAFGGSVSNKNDAFDDEPFDVEAVVAGAWWPTRYGPQDQLGTYNEVTAEKTRTALRMLDLDRPVRTYNLAETLFNGFPAIPGRSYHQTLSICGFPPPPNYEGLVKSTEPLGSLISTLEERVSYTFNMGTKINGLHHVGIGGVFYNGFKGSDIVRTGGTTKLGMETQPPIVTRGIVVDVLGTKVSTGQTEAYVTLANGAHCLIDGYRITIDDIEEALDHEGVQEPVGAGDVVLLRTGWREHIHLDPDKYINGAVPGIGLREARYLAANLPAIIGIDVWFFRSVSHEGHGGMLAHQELALRFGVRVGEAVTVEELVSDGVYEFVFCFNPTHARGAISSNAPPTGLGQPRG